MLNREGKKNNCLSALLAAYCGSAVRENVPGGSLPVTDTAYTPGLKLPVGQQWNTNIYTHFMADNIENDLGRFLTVCKWNMTLIDIKLC